MLLPFAVALLVLVVCIRYLHGKRPVDAFTGRTRLDIKRCLYAALVWGGLTLVITGVQCIMDHSTLRFHFDLLPFLGTCLVLIIFLPFQVAWEECLFRGYLMQGFAALFAYRWIPLVLTSVIFGLMHSANPEIDRFGFWITMPQYILMGLIIGYVTIKDGGIELALGLHLANNLLVSLLVTHEASALPTSALFIDTDPSISPSDILVTVVCGIIFIWLCNRKYRFIPGEKLEGKVKKEDYVVPLACETEHDQTKDFNS
jgi:membrane protease YdiL (CAAX protease family)